MRFFTDITELAAHRETVWRLLGPVAADACKGEFTMADLWELAIEGKAIIGLTDDMAGAFEFRHYPQFMAVNILALGGKGLPHFMADVLPAFRQWAAGAGAQRVEASCSEAMARMLARGGFQQDYIQVSIPVGEPC